MLVLALLGAALAAPPNVVVIVVDALRADRLGLLVEGQDLTPGLSRLSKRSQVFSRTVSQAAWSVPATASLLTSLDPQVHRVLRYQPDQRLPDDFLADAIPTLAEQFAAAGYDTTALLKTVVVAKNRGLGQGFNTWRIVEGDMADKASATQLTEAALEYLTIRPQDKPFFLYLHYMDPHANYIAPEPYYSKAMGEYRGAVTGGYNQIYDSYVTRGVIPSRADLAQIERFYNAEVSYVDSELGRLLVSMFQQGLDPNTIVVVTADHGEALYEHDRFFESHVFQENIAVPLIIKVPGLNAAQHDALTQSIDIAPTLLELCGLPIPATFQGRSLVSLWGGGSITGTAYAEYGPYQALLTEDGQKLIVGDGAVKLFNILKDPQEHRDLVAGGWKEVQRMKTLLEARVASWAPLRSKLGLE